MSESETGRFVKEYRGLLEKYGEPLRLKHQIHIEIYRSVKEV